MSDHPFDHAITLQSVAPGLHTGRTSAAYWNSISPYGGITVATILHAIDGHPQRLGEPLSITVNFAGAIRAGAFHIRSRPARTGRSTQHWSFELVQDDELEPLATGSAVFALARKTWADDERRMPAAPRPEALLPAAPLLDIPFLQRYAVRYVDGNPLAGGPSSRTRSWLADAPPRKLDFRSLAAFCDSFIPRLFVRLGAARQVATVTLSINFHVDAAGLAAESGMQVFTEAWANAFNRGYYDQEGLLWGESGKLLASTHQMVWYRD